MIELYPAIKGIFVSSTIKSVIVILAIEFIMTRISIELMWRWRRYIRRW